MGAPYCIHELNEIQRNLTQQQIENYIAFHRAIIPAFFLTLMFILSIFYFYG